MKNVPRNTGAPEWLVALQSYLKLVVPKRNSQPVDEPATCGPDASQAAHSPATGGPPPATGGGPANGPPPPPAVVATPAAVPPQIGDVVISTSTKKNESFDNVKCKVVGLLSTMVKVALLEGADKGKLHKYLYKHVKPLVTTTGAASSSVAVAAATGLSLIHI